MAILVVEDELRVRAFIKRGLEEEGYAVHEAQDGLQAINTLLEGGFELVLLDWMLPGLNGLQRSSSGCGPART